MTQRSWQRLTDPEGRVLHLTPEQPSRLVVFVHGFWGGAVTTWRERSLSSPVRRFVFEFSERRPPSLRPAC
jgi:hypothetical protein